MPKFLAYGFVLALALGLIAVLVMPNVGYPLFFAPGVVLASLFGPVVPEGAVHWLFPDGGPSAGVALLLFGAFVFWWLLFAAICAVVANQWAA